jgi:hypothetical protein
MPTSDGALLWHSILVLSLIWGADGAQSSGISHGFVPTDQAVLDQLNRVPRYRAFLPLSVDLSKHFPTPGMQDAESCTGWAVGYAARSYYTATIEKRDLRDWGNVPSPSYIYNSIRDPQDCASGSEIPRALELLQQGSLSVEEFDTECQIPTAADRARVSDFKIKSWLALDPKKIDDVKGQLALGHPVIIGINVGDKFTEFRGKGIYKGEPKTGYGHAMTVVGYDDQRQAFRVINSWGTRWGDKGFGWIEYEAFKKGAKEAYIIEVESKPVPVPDVPMVAPQKPIVKPEPAPTVEVTVVVPEKKTQPEPPPKKAEETEIVIPAIERPVVDSDCSLVYSETANGKQRLTGFVGTEKDLQALRDQWSGYGAEIDVQIRPWPQCEVLLTLASVIGEKDGPQLSTLNEKVAFKEGDEMVFELTTPPSPAYVYVVYVQADGSVVTLMQPGSDLSPSQRDERVVFGDGAGGKSRFKASPPFGTEMVLAVTSASPLFEGSLPSIQTEREFLSSLRRAVIYKSDEAKGDRRISAAFLGIETEAKR